MRSFFAFYIVLLFAVSGHALAASRHHHARRHVAPSSEFRANPDIESMFTLQRRLIGGKMRPDGIGEPVRR